VPRTAARSTWQQVKGNKLLPPLLPLLLLPYLRHCLVEEGLHVHPHIRVGILQHTTHDPVDRQAVQDLHQLLQDLSCCMLLLCTAAGSAPQWKDIVGNMTALLHAAPDTKARSHELASNTARSVAAAVVRAGDAAAEYDEAGAAAAFAAGAAATAHLIDGQRG
jgi:hypothetical protein